MNMSKFHVLRSLSFLKRIKNTDERLMFVLIFFPFMRKQHLFVYFHRYPITQDIPTFILFIRQILRNPIEKYRHL